MANLLEAAERSELEGRRPHIERSRRDGPHRLPAGALAHLSACACAVVLPGRSVAADRAWAAPPPGHLCAPQQLQDVLQMAYNPAWLRLHMCVWLAGMEDGAAPPGGPAHHAAVGQWMRVVGAQSVRHANGGPQHALMECLHAHLGLGALEQHRNATRRREATPEAQTRVQLRHAELLALCDALTKQGLDEAMLLQRAGARAGTVGPLRAVVFVSMACCNICRSVLAAVARVFKMDIKAVQCKVDGSPVTTIHLSA